MKAYTQFFAITAMALLGGLVSNSQASIILYPDVSVDTGRAVYTVANHTLTLTGKAEFVNTSNSISTPLTGGTFSASFVLTPISGSGAGETFSVASGSLLVQDSSTTLFSSTTPLNFSFSSDNFDANFGGGSGTQSTGGLIHLSYHALGGLTGYSTYFDADFSSSSVVKIGTADVFAVPEPTSLSLLGLAVPMLLRRRRRA